MTHAPRIALVLAWEIVLALHLQAAADWLGVSPLKRLGKAWAASAARRLKNVAKARA